MIELAPTTGDPTSRSNTCVVLQCALSPSGKQIAAFGKRRTSCRQLGMPAFGRGRVKTRLSMSATKQSVRCACYPIQRIQAASLQRNDSAHCRYGMAFSHRLGRNRSSGTAAGYPAPSTAANNPGPLFAALPVIR